MRLIIDIDEVLVDFIGPLIAEYNRRYSSDITIKDITQWSLPKDMCRIFHEKDYFLNLVPYPRSQTVMNNVFRDRGYDVVIASSPSHSPDIAAQKLTWTNHYFPGTPLVLTERKDILKGDVMIDDGVHHLQGFEGRKIIMDRPWNEHYTDVDYRVNNWIAIVRAVRDLEQRI